MALQQVRLIFVSALPSRFHGFFARQGGPFPGFPTFLGETIALAAQRPAAK
jgi:hypothetical protein